LNLNLNHIISFCKGVFDGNSPEVTVNHISIDSRSLQNGSNTLFFAIKGKNHDAHLYLDELITKGVRYFVVEYIPEHLSKKANFIIVENSLIALQQTAIAYRKQFDFPFVGITGSNGKTIVKEWLNFLLSEKHLIVRNPKSYNSQVGVTLSILGIEGNYDLGIFEAGISLPNEMSNLEQMIQPKYGILTNIGSAHDEGFPNREAKIKEKIKLFENCSDIFMEKNAEIETLLSENSQKHTWSFSDESANLFVSKKNTKDTTELTFKNKANIFTVIVPFSDENSIENVITCVNFLLFLGEEIAFIQSRVAVLYPIELSLQA